jgi:hypothetical protein
MGPVGSRRTPTAPSGQEPPSAAPRRRWALIAVIALFAIMCGMIAWSQWYAIHVNVPFYQTHRAPVPGN